MSQSNYTQIVDMSAAGRIAARNAAKLRQTAEEEQRILDKLRAERWSVDVDENGNWSARRCNVCVARRCA
jgi:hypothetical protein